MENLNWSKVAGSSGRNWVWSIVDLDIRRDSWWKKSSLSRVESMVDCDERPLSRLEFILKI